MTTSSLPAPAPYVLLDDNTGHGAPSALYENPVEIVCAREPAEVRAALARLEEAGRQGLHAAGFFAYELGYALEPRLHHLMPDRRDVPLLWFGLFRAPRILDSAGVEAFLAERTAGKPVPRLTDITHSWSEAAYVERFNRVIDYIRAGDVYQINLTFRARFRLQGDPLGLYRQLRRNQRVAYGGVIETGEMTVLSASPELFIEQFGRVVQTRPMKGTAPRGGAAADDDAARHLLATDAKQRAENLMIVDLMRNDLGRISEVGSVQVTDLFTVETFKTLHQMTSGVRSRIVEGTNLSRLLEAIFPPGSVTGAPKIRAIEIIAELEDSPRGVYCGGIGRISPDGHALFNVAIRTPVFRPDGHGEMGIGSGVVADSEGSREYAECLLKMKFLTGATEPFELIETLLYDPAVPEVGGYWLLDRHMERLARSAANFGYPCDLSVVRAALDAKAAELGAQRSRVRMTLAADGTVAVTAAAMPAAPAGQVIGYVVSQTRLDSAEPFLRHKTTRRQLYDREWQAFHDSAGADEVIYLNEKGELGEGSRTNIFLERDGVLLTPPLSAGALPGVLRAELLATGKAKEQTLTLADLTTGPVYLGNSVRGLQRAKPL